MGGPRKAQTVIEEKKRAFIITIIKGGIDMRHRVFMRTVMATALAVATAVAGIVGQAQAFSFGEADLVLAIYGNNTEALYNLGQVSTRLAPGASFSLDVSAGLTSAQVGTNPVKYTVFEWDLGSTGGQVIGASTFSPSQIAAAGSLGLNNQLNNGIGMAFAPAFTGNTQPISNFYSFTGQMNSAGNGSLGGSWPVAMQGNLDQILKLIQGDVDAGTLSQVGGVLLSSAGLLTIGNPGPAAVPLPAGVVLFGTGLIGLVGIARRSFNRMAGMAA